MRYKALNYSLKVWLTTIFVAPVGVVFLQRNPPRRLINYLQGYLWTVLGDLILFAPSILLFIYVSYVMSKTYCSTMIKKLVILGQALALFVAIWWLFFYYVMDVNIFSESNGMEIPIVYLSVIALGTLFYDLNSLDTALPN